MVIVSSRCFGGASFLLDALFNIQKAMMISKTTIAAKKTRARRFMRRKSFDLSSGAPASRSGAVDWLY
jgi:hypothetical protein